MQSCETSTDKGSLVKRVTVRTGGAGHALTGVVNPPARDHKNAASSDALPARSRAPKQTNNKIVTLGS